MDVNKKPVAARRWYHWHEPGTTKEDKWLIFKLDVNVLTYLCLVCLFFFFCPRNLARPQMLRQNC